MSLFKPKCMFSKIDGIVLENGIPVEGAEVEKYYSWGWSWPPDKPRAKTVKTDKQGAFHFPAAYEWSLITSIFPHNPSIYQQITIKYQGTNYEAYLRWKGNYKESGELDGQPLDFVCELKNEPSREGGFYGVCTLR